MTYIKKQDLLNLLDNLHADRDSAVQSLDEPEYLNLHDPGCVERAIKSAANLAYFKAARQVFWMLREAVANLPEVEQVSAQIVVEPVVPSADVAPEPTV